MWNGVFVGFSGWQTGSILSGQSLVPKDWLQPRDRKADRSGVQLQPAGSSRLPVCGLSPESFDALLEGAKDLAYVTGGIPDSEDHSETVVRTSDSSPSPGWTITTDENGKMTWAENAVMTQVTGALS